ncbi:MAG: patatin-like phospholipase family protein [Gemmatimonadaceae bacterium]|nr:patatin-like phospholipase family protein [Gemmatimonadaceae bacterium]
MPVHETRSSRVVVSRLQIIGVRGFIAHGLALAVAMVAGGCAAVHRPPASIASLVTDADSSRLRERALRDTVIARLARRVVKRADHTVDVLLLSGGGQNGAYGVGFVRGWRDRTDAPMPQFDLITAISTGALQAPFLLLGSTAAVDTLTSLYRNAADRIAPSIDWWFWLRKTGGLVNTRRYDTSIANVVDSTLRDSLRTAFAQDRQVVFGTTDMDIGTGRTWDLATTLNGSNGLVTTRTLLRAASAIPGIFPQVVFEGHVHSDGGVVSNILSLLTLDDYKAMVAKVRAAGVTAPISVRMWVIVNGWTTAAPMVMNPASLKQINRRWSNLSFYMHHPQVLEGLDYLARAASAEVPGLTMQMKWTAIPSELAIDPAASSLFDKGWMQRLETLGTTRARSAKPWDSIHSPYVRPVPQTP